MEIKEEPVEFFITSRNPDPVRFLNANELKIKNEPVEEEPVICELVKRGSKRRNPNPDPLPILTAEQIRVKNEEAEEVVYVTQKKRSKKEARRSPSPFLDDQQLKKVKTEHETALKNVLLVEKIGNLILKYKEFKIKINFYI